MVLLILLFIFMSGLKAALDLVGLPFDLRVLLQPSTVFLHQLCLDQTETFNNQSEAAAALVCGHQIESLDLQTLFASSGLIHLLVVSGSHLLVMDKGFNFFRLKPALKLTLLFIFVLVCEMNAPIMRSFMAMLVAGFVKSKKWAWSASFNQWVTSFLCLVINPLWIFSLSFQMSWMASLCLDIASHSFTEEKLKQSLVRLFLIYFSFVFISCFLGFPSAWAPLLGLALSPVLELILFPSALLGCLIPPLSFVFDSLFSLLTHFICLFNPEKYFPFYLQRETSIYLNSFMIILLLMIQMKWARVKS